MSGTGDGGVRPPCEWVFRCMGETDLNVTIPEWTSRDVLGWGRKFQEGRKQRALT